MFIGYIALFSFAEHLRWPDYFAGRFHNPYLMLFVWFVCMVTVNPRQTLAQRPNGFVLSPGRLIRRKAGPIGTSPSTPNSGAGARLPRTESTEA